MPLYEFQCQKCEKVIEEITKNRNLKYIPCPECDGICKKIMSAAGWDIRGGGVYRTGPPAPQPKKKRS